MNRSASKKLFVYASILSIGALFSCGECNFNFGLDPGEKVEFGSGQEIYYKDGATEEEAQALGEYLKEIEYFSGNNSNSVQLVRDGDTYVVRFVLKEGYWEKDENMGAYKKMGRDISAMVFDSAPVEVHLCNDQLETQRKLTWEEIERDAPSLEGVPIPSKQGE